MKRLHVMGTVLCIFFFGILMGYVVWNTKSEDAFLGSKEISSENKNWSLSWNYNRKGSIQLPSRQEGESGDLFSITKQMKFFNSEEQYLCFRSVQNKVRVYVDGGLVYSYGYKGKYALSKAPGIRWNVVKLSGEKNKYSVEIEFESPYRFYSGIMPCVYTGTKTALHTYIVKKEMPYFFIGLVVILVALFIFVSYLVLRDMEFESGLYLAIVVFCLGLWFLSESKLSQFLIHDVYCASQVECILSCIFPSILCTYMVLLRDYEKDMWIRGMYHASLLGFAMTSFMVVYRLIDYVEVRPYTVFLYAGILAGIVINGFLRWKKNKKIKSLKWRDAGLILLLITAIHDMFMLCLSTRIVGGRWFHFGVIFFIGINFLGYEREFATMYVSKLEKDHFRKLAYTDSLTGLNNRVSFEEEMDMLRARDTASNEVYVIIIDMNNLKKINDTLGHKMGDKAIKKVADAIRGAFLKEGTCYRIGGDEFCVLAHKMNGIKVKYVLDKLTHDIENVYFLEGYTLSVAFGYEVYMQTEDRSIDDVFVQADKNMYQCKQKMKRAGKKCIDIN
ncbi:GGDEF domain-containing protein [[Clostridium] polysaccharolyticum]|uniref:Diguanylate cyclase (GGDEF) domain-containing protein n=1 Tax=[Clostridium] polysaccharolyticum TaxID=29364 RepID=A0A1I0G0Q1_9FIRM|nr:GGDEF domain-containing protein [[Clostridium] polysaccharolyticum]SET63428.1 diguanylate cyclase (GGDEF) domain-containing protein [[Clostridium] polysaccharolyticum]